MKLVSRTVVFTSILAIAFAAFSATEARAQGVVNEILKRMEAHQESLQSLQADIELAKTNSQLNITDKQKGEVYFIPGKGGESYIRINLSGPDEILVVANGKYLFYQPRLSQAYKGKVKGSKNAKASSALAFISMSKTQIRANYKPPVYIGNESVSGSKTWHLKLVPKGKESYKYAELWVDGNGMILRAKIVEQNDDYTTVTLSDLKKNVRIPGDVFRYKPPSKTKFIDG